MREGATRLRFLIAGGVNTGVTYLMYLGFLQFTSYQISYTIAFVCGIGISYILSRMFVFKVHQGYRSALMLPLIYLFQYLLGAAVVWTWVGFFHRQPMFAPIISILITLPITYILSKYAFVGWLK